MITKTTLGACLWRVRLHTRGDHAKLLQEPQPKLFLPHFLGASPALRLLAPNAGTKQRGRDRHRPPLGPLRTEPPLFPRPLQCVDNNKGLLLLAYRNPSGILKVYPHTP